MTQQHTVWVSRDRDSLHWVWQVEPQTTWAKVYKAHDDGFALAPWDAATAFGFTLAPGECRKVTITSEVVE